MDLQSELKSYLKNITGESVELTALEPEFASSLPLYLKNAFRFYQMHLFSAQLLAAFLAHPNKTDLSQVLKQREALIRISKIPVVLVLPRIKSFERRRLIQKKVAFVVPNRQLYLPMLLVDMRERFSIAMDAHAETLSWVSQVLLLRHVLRDDISNQPLATIARKLGYSAMALSQAAEELEKQELCKKVRQGKSKTLEFVENRRALWDKSLPMMRSPLRKTIYVRDFSESAMVPVLRAGISALADQTELASHQPVTFAIESNEGTRAVESGRLQPCEFEEDAAAIIQLWSYCPETLSVGDAVDPLSLYLTFKDDPDERIQAALDDLIKVAPWSQD